jgi:hypothetical protein
MVVGVGVESGEIVVAVGSEVELPITEGVTVGATVVGEVVVSFLVAVTVGGGVGLMSSSIWISSGVWLVLVGDEEDIEVVGVTVGSGVVVAEGTVVGAGDDVVLILGALVWFPVTSDGVGEAVVGAVGAEGVVVVMLPSVVDGVGADVMLPAGAVVRPGVTVLFPPIVGGVGAWVESVVIGVGEIVLLLPEVGVEGNDIGAGFVIGVGAMVIFPFWARTLTTLSNPLRRKRYTGENTLIIMLLTRMNSLSFEVW